MDMGMWNDVEEAFSNNAENRIKTLIGLKDSDDLFTGIDDQAYKKIVLRSLYSANEWWCRFIKKTMTREFPYTAIEKNEMCTSALYGISEKIYLRHFFNHDGSVIKDPEIKQVVIMQGYYGLAKIELKYNADNYIDISDFVDKLVKISRTDHFNAISKYPLNTGTLLQLYQNDIDIINKYKPMMYSAVKSCIGDTDNPYCKVYQHWIEEILETMKRCTVNKFDNFKDKMRPVDDLLHGFRIEQGMIVRDNIGMIRRLPQLMNDKEFYKKIYMKL